MTRISEKLLLKDENLVSTLYYFNYFTVVNDGLHHDTFW